jgi:hypothetical protein
MLKIHSHLRTYQRDAHTNAILFHFIWKNQTKLLARPWAVLPMCASTNAMAHLDYARTDYGGGKIIAAANHGHSMVSRSHAVSLIQLHSLPPLAVL